MTANYKAGRQFFFYSFGDWIATSAVVTEAIVEEVGDSYYTLKVDGTCDPTGYENISIVLRFVNES